MAGIEHRSGSYRVLFRYQGKQRHLTLGQVSKDEAETKAAQVDYLLMRLKQRLAFLPPGMTIVEYVQFDGKQPEAGMPAATKLSLAQLRDKYLATHNASLEANTISTARMHFRHLTGHFREGFPIAELTLADLQGYVDHRTKAKWNGRKLSAETIKKEITTLRTAWNWGERMKMVIGRYPNAGLRYPRMTEKPPFQTLAEIERQVIAGGLTASEIAELYDSAYLQLHETTELLAYVNEQAAHGFIYPLFCMAAHTGARRSELIRMTVADVDLAGKTITIREKKRVKGQATTRRVPMSAFLIGVLNEWLTDHPGGPWLFCHEPTVVRSKKRSRTTGHLDQKSRPKSGKERLARIALRELREPTPLTKDELHHHFKRTLKGSKWAVLRGLHSLRHSFISACASRGVDQRLVQEFSGHMSEEMSRRYRHIWPSAKDKAIAAVFDAA
jgi:integrase